jgi:hypothetical protein
MIYNIGNLNKLLSKRNSGSTNCSFKSMNNSVNEINKELFLDELGFKSDEIKNEWEKVDETTAKKILEYILSYDMAYDAELGTKAKASLICSYFLNEFQSDAIFFTNGYFDEDAGFFKLSAWTPLTDSTFDTGILAIDKNKIGILWAEDND